MYKKILVPIDGSKQANKALAKAIELAKIHDSEIEILHVMTVTENLPSEPDMSNKSNPSEWIEEYLHKIKNKDEQMLNEALDKAKKGNITGKVKSKLLIGKPADTILREATQEGFDLIVIGDRGISGLKELVLGSVSNQVVDEAKIDVLVIK